MDPFREWYPSILDHFWIIFGSFLDHFWIRFANSIHRFWIIFGSFLQLYFFIKKKLAELQLSGALGAHARREPTTKWCPPCRPSQIRWEDREASQAWHAAAAPRPRFTWTATPARATSPGACRRCSVWRDRQRPGFWYLSWSLGLVVKEAVCGSGGRRVEPRRPFTRTLIGQRNPGTARGCRCEGRESRGRHLASAHRDSEHAHCEG